MFRVIVTMVFTASCVAAGEPIPATKVPIDEQPRTLAETFAILSRQGQLTIDVSKTNGPQMLKLKQENPLPLWLALDKVAEQSGHRVEIVQQGRSVLIVPGRSLTAASIDGPFRVTVTGVTAKTDFLSQKTYYDVTLLLHWEPRFPVFRIDTVPAVSTAIDDQGTKLTCQSAKTKSPIGNAFSFSTTVRFDGLTRGSKSIARLEGSFVVTASPKMLTFTFDDLTKLPDVKKDSNVSVSLTKMASVGDRWDAEVKLIYPDSHPEFESFETWADHNTLKLISPDRTKSYTHSDFSTIGSGRRVTCEYRFLKSPVDGLKGWTLTYATPAPLTEFTVRFSLLDIPLP